MKKLLLLGLTATIISSASASNSNSELDGEEGINTGTSSTQIPEKLSMSDVLHMLKVKAKIDDDHADLLEFLEKILDKEGSSISTPPSLK